MISGLVDPSIMAELYAGFIDIVVLKGTVVVLAAVMVCRLLRRSSAAIRHGVWATALFVLLALPVLRSVVPQSGLTIVGMRSPPVAVSMPEVGAAATTTLEITARPGEPVPRSAELPTASVQPAVTTVGVAPHYAWIVGIWFLGLFLQLTRFGGHLRAVRRLRGRAEPCPDHLQRRVQGAAAELGLRRPPVTIVSPDITVPSTFGLMRPTVVLPRDISGWSSDKLDAALLHEFAHLRRRDYLTHLLTALVKATYWVNPAVWYAGHRLDMERERACDDGVVVDRVDPIRYAEYLMSLAWSGRQRAAQPVLSFATRSSLPERVKSLLDQAQARTPVGTATRGAMVALAGLAIATGGVIEIFGVVPSPGQATVALSDQDPGVRRYAAWAAGESESPAHVDELIEHLSDSDARVRAVSAWALGEIKDPRAIEALTALLADEDERVREMAALAIGEIEDPSGLAALRGAGPAAVSVDARAWAIAQIEHVEGYSEVFSGALSHPDARDADLPHYLDQLADANPRVRALAAERLGILGASEAVEPLLDALEDEDPAVRATVVWALDEINPSRRERSPSG
jgi:beta-lactamase regulating signal transducer with metallopeptidase domain